MSYFNDNAKIVLTTDGTKCTLVTKRLLPPVSLNKNVSNTIYEYLSRAVKKVCIENGTS